MKNAIYDQIGTTYDTTRRADPNIVSQIIELLHLDSNRLYLDIGCGSGNYTGALASSGVNITGLDFSGEMLSKARSKYPAINFHQGDATQLPFESNLFAGAICILATHHIGNNELTFKEAFRVIQKGFLVLFTATPRQMSSYWLNHYFPTMMAESSKRMASYHEIKEDLEKAGFLRVASRPYYITNQLVDLFLQSGKYRPDIYLNPAVRAGISSFQLTANHKEIEQGLAQLESDIKSGVITQVIENYQSDSGDYMFIVAEK